MKLASINTADYNGSVLRVDGLDDGRHPATIEIAVPDKTAFLGFIQAVMYEKEMEGQESRVAFPATALAFGLHKDGTGNHSVTFTFDILTGGRMRFVLPVATTSDKRLNAIKGHLQQALLEMGAVERAKSQ